MPIVRVDLIAGRPAETKRQLVRELTDAVERALGASRSSIRVLLNEVPATDWAVGGEPLATERE